MTHPEAVEAVAKALAASCGLDLDNLTTWRTNWLDDGRVAVDALIAAGWAPRAEVAPPHEHLIYLRADFNWELHLHEACKDDTERCPVTVAVLKADSFPDYAPGDYVCGVNADGELELRPVVPRVTERQAMAAEIAAAIEAYPGARGPAIDDPRDPRRAGLDTARRIARDLGKAATT